MYLHLGQSVVVPEAEIIGVFDLDNTTGSHITRKYLADAEKKGLVISVSDELPKSFVVCCEKNPLPHGQRPSVTKQKDRADSKIRIYLSQLNSQTLLKRAGTTQIS